MTPNPLRPITVSLLAALALALAACADRRISRAIVRWRAAKLPKGPDAEREREELEGMVEELNAAERAELSAQLLLQPACLNCDIPQRTDTRHVVILGNMTFAVHIDPQGRIIAHPDLLYRLRGRPDVKLKVITVHGELVLETNASSLVSPLL